MTPKCPRMRSNVHLAGAREQQQRIPLRPLLEGATSSHRDAVVSGLHEFRIVYDGRYKLVSFRDGESALYDLQEDPWEDVAVAKPAIADGLREVLHAEIPTWRIP